MPQAEYGWAAGARPGPLEFRVVPAGPVARAVIGAAATCVPVPDGAVLRALEPPAGPVGRYRLDAGDAAWFVRVSSRPGAPTVELAISDHLQRHGVPVNHPVAAGLPLAWEGRTLRVDVRPALDGRHFAGDPGDLVALGTTLAACHRALRTLPVADEVRGRTVRRSARLLEVRDRLRRAVAAGDLALFAEHRGWAEAHRDWLREMADDFSPAHHLSADAQCLHGEVHVGNVVLTDRAVLVDVEEGVHTYAPPAWDLATVVQRFCQPAGTTDPALVAALATGYGGLPPDLRPMMRQIAWAAVATVLDRRLADGEVAPEAELAKFVELERRADADG